MDNLILTLAFSDLSHAKKTFLVKKTYKICFSNHYFTINIAYRYAIKVITNDVRKMFKTTKYLNVNCMNTC